MGNDRLAGKKRTSREGETEDPDDGEEFGSSSTQKKRQRQDSQPSGTSLLHLPVELLYSIHLYAKNQSFTILNHHFRDIFKSCPISIKARYLLARWHEAYCYGFQPTGKQFKAKGITRSNHHILPSGPKDDLLEDGSLPELNWSSRFLPVLPTSDFTYPLSNSHQRSADHFILDYCLRYPICNHEVLSIVEDRILNGPEFGNIIFVTGLWRDSKGQLCTYDIYCGHKRECGQGGDIEYKKPSHLIVNELPRRIFQNFETNEPKQSNKTARAESDHQSSSSTPPIPLNQLDPLLRLHLERLGGGPLPNLSSLLLFLEIVALHVPLSPTHLGALRLINSFDGYPLVKSTFYKSQFMLQMLLCLGADPARGEKKAMLVAIRSGWLEGLKIMVERDEGMIRKWEAVLMEVTIWFRKKEERRRGIIVQPEATETEVEEGDLGRESSRLDSNPTQKRRRLLDRAKFDSAMLKEAVKRSHWPIVNFIRSKGVAPDLKTIKLIEARQDSPALQFP